MDVTLSENERQQRRSVGIHVDATLGRGGVRDGFAAWGDVGGVWGRGVECVDPDLRGVSED